MDVQKLTKEQAVIISGFTGILCGEFSDFHADVEKRLGRGVQTFEFGFKEFSAEVKRLYEADFIEMGTVSKEEAKAQAVLEVKPSRCVTLTCAQLREAFMFGAPDKDDQEQLETEMTISWSENGHSGKGYYCYYSDLPEEGAIFLDDVIEAQEQAYESK